MQIKKFVNILQNCNNTWKLKILKNRPVQKYAFERLTIFKSRTKSYNFMLQIIFNNFNLTKENYLSQLEGRLIFRLLSWSSYKKSGSWRIALYGNLSSKNCLIDFELGMMSIVVAYNVESVVALKYLQ